MDKLKKTITLSLEMVKFNLICCGGYVICGSVGRVVASNKRGHHFESSLQI